MTRKLRPRATTALSIAPATITDRSAPAVLGLEPREFRDLVQELKVPHVRPRGGHAHRLIVRVDDMLTALSRASTKADDAPVTVDEDDDEPRSADEVLAAIGRRRTA